MSKRVLITEDDTFLRELYHEMLSDSGYEVDIATNGAEGLEKIKANQYDIVLLDIMMPEKDGLQVLRDLSDDQKKVPFVMLTNLGQDQVIKDALAIGAQGYLIKSELNPDEVLEKVKEYIGDAE